jgi:hypothetical protein
MEHIPAADTSSRLQRIIAGLRENQVLLAILFLALAIRLWGICFGLPDIEHGDESEVVNHAVRFGGGDFNPHRFQYGSLFQYLLFVLYGCYFLVSYASGSISSVHQFAVHFVQGPTVFYMIARGFSALLGTATVALTYSLGKNLKNKETGFAAALFLAACFTHAVNSHYCTVDVAVTFLFTASVYTSLLLFQRSDFRHYAAAGLLTGLALATKFNGIIAMVTLVAVHFLRDNSGGFFSRCRDKKLWAAVAAIFIGHFVACPFFYLDLGTALSEVAELKAFHTGAGFTLLTYLKGFMNNYWGLPLGAICLIGFFRAAVTRSRERLALFITAAAVLLFASQYKYAEAKYILYAFPVFAVLGGMFFIECCSRLNRTSATVIALLIIMQPLYLVCTWDYEHAQKSINHEAREWIEANIPLNAKILLDNIGNAGPKLENSPEQLQQQYQRALQHKLLKADYLKLKLESKPKIYYKIYQVDSDAGSRRDDYLAYRLWQDTEEIGHPPDYYREKGFDYIIITDSYFSQIGNRFQLVKEFKRGNRGIRIYKIR